jgi:hypothetical protein
MKTTNKKQGSLMIGVLIMMLIVSATSIAIVNRSRHGATLATDSKKGYAAYQASDTNIEKILNDFRELDNDVTIPENTDYSSYCGDKCYDKDGSTVLVAGKKVSDIYFIEKKGVSQLATRTIRVPMLDRVENPVNSFTIAKTGVGCNIKLTIIYSNNIPSPWNNVSELEVRRSTNGSLSGGTWTKINATATIDDFLDTPVLINASEFPIGSTYYIALKAKNKNPLMLDSLFVISSNSFACP